LSKPFVHGLDGSDTTPLCVVLENFTSNFNLQAIFAPNQAMPTELRDSYDVNSIGILNDDL
jgi:hypothetical protein